MLFLLKHKAREIQIIIKEGFVIALTRSPRLKSDIKCNQLALTLWVAVSDVTHPASVFTLHLAAHFVTVGVFRNFAIADDNLKHLRLSCTHFKPGSSLIDTQLCYAI